MSNENGAQAPALSDALDAKRYRWLRDAHPASEDVWVAQGLPSTTLNCLRYEDLDAAIDAALATPEARTQAPEATGAEPTAPR